MDKKARLLRVYRLGKKALSQGLYKTAALKKLTGWFDSITKNLSDFGSHLYDSTVGNAKALYDTAVDKRSLIDQFKDWWGKASGTVVGEPLTDAQKQLQYDKFMKIVLGAGAAGLGVGALANYALDDAPSVGSAVTSGLLGALAIGGATALVAAPNTDNTRDVPIGDQIQNIAEDLSKRWWPFEGYLNLALLGPSTWGYIRGKFANARLTNILNAYGIGDKAIAAAKKLPFTYRFDIVLRLKAMAGLDPAEVKSWILSTIKNAQILSSGRFRNWIDLVSPVPLSRKPEGASNLRYLGSSLGIGNMYSGVPKIYTSPDIPLYPGWKKIKF